MNERKREQNCKVIKICLNFRPELEKIINKMNNLEEINEFLEMQSLPRQNRNSEPDCFRGVFYQIFKELYSSQTISIISLKIMF